MILVHTVLFYCCYRSDEETNRHNEVKEEGHEEACSPKVLKKFRIVKTTSLFQKING